MAQDIGYSNSWPLTLPHDTFFGMAAGVATNSKGHVFVYTRNTDPIMVLGGSRAFAHGGSSLYEFAPGGKFVRQIGKQIYGFLAAQQVRVDPHDNIWVVDRYSDMVIKLEPAGQCRDALGPQAGIGGRAVQARYRTRHAAGLGRSKRSVRIAGRCGLGFQRQYLCR